MHRSVYDDCPFCFNIFLFLSAKKKDITFFCFRWLTEKQCEQYWRNRYGSTTVLFRSWPKLWVKLKAEDPVRWQNLTLLLGTHFTFPSGARQWPAVLQLLHGCRQDFLRQKVFRDQQCLHDKNAESQRLKSPGWILWSKVRQSTLWFPSSCKRPCLEL